MFDAWSWCLLLMPCSCLLSMPIVDVWCLILVPVINDLFMVLSMPVVAVWWCLILVPAININALFMFFVDACCWCLLLMFGDTCGCLQLINAITIRFFILLTVLLNGLPSIGELVWIAYIRWDYIRSNQISLFNLDSTFKHVSDFQSGADIKDV